LAAPTPEFRTAEKAIQQSQQIPHFFQLQPVEFIESYTRDPKVAHALARDGGGADTSWHELKTCVKTKDFQQTSWRISKQAFPQMLGPSKRAGALF
jgi:hypothetical protein